jgi:hypothetical protein
MNTPSPAAIESLRQLGEETSPRCRAPIVEHNGWLLYSYTNGTSTGYSALEIGSGGQVENVRSLRGIEQHCPPGFSADTWELFRNLIALA